MIALLLRARDAKHVAVYTIHEAPTPPVDRIDRAEALEFVPDGFTWSAVVFPPLFLITHRMWAELLAYLAAVIVGLSALTILGVSPALTLVLLAAGHIWLAYEAVELRRQAMQRAGWQTLGSVSGRNLAECERRFFDMWLTGDGTDRLQQPAPGQPTAMGELDKALTGLFSRFNRAKT